MKLPKNLEETETLELKAIFKIKDIKKEFTGMLNKSSPGKEVSIYVGVNDDGTLNEGYVTEDTSENLDLLVSWLNQFEITVTKECHEGFDIFKAVANKQILIIDGRVYYRYNGTTKEIDKLGDYPILLKTKNIDITEQSDKIAKKDDFLQLEKRTIDLDGGMTFDDFLTNTQIFINVKQKLYETEFAKLMRDDATIYATVFGKKIQGPLFEIFFETLATIKKNDKEILQQDGTRKRLVQLNSSFNEITREAISNAIAHSYFKGILDEPIFTVEKKGNGFIVKNNIADSIKLRAMVLYKHKKHRPHNAIIWHALDLMNICEGKNLGMSLFYDNEDFVHLEVMMSYFSVLIGDTKGEK